MAFVVNCHFIPRMACRWIAWLIETNLMGKKPSRVTRYAAEHYLTPLAPGVVRAAAVESSLLINSPFCFSCHQVPQMSSYASDRLTHTPVACRSWCLYHILKAWSFALPSEPLTSMDVLISNISQAQCRAAPMISSTQCTW